MSNTSEQGMSTWRKVGMVARNAFSSTLNREVVGEEVQGAPFVVTHGESLAYAMAVGDSNPAYFQKHGAIACPLLASRILIDVLERIVLHRKLGMNVLKLVHAEQSFHFIRPIEIGAELLPRAKVTRIREVSSGEILDADVAISLGPDMVVEGVATLFLRGKKRKKGKAEETPAQQAEGDGAGAESESPQFEPVATLTVAPDQPRRYAAASHDFNPLHTRPWVARLAGFKAPIAHGMCVLAMASASLVKLYGEDDPALLKKLSVRFSKPAYPGEELILKVASGAGTYRFVLEDPKGRPVLSRGEVEFRQSF